MQIRLPQSISIPEATAAGLVFGAVPLQGEVFYGSPPQFLASGGYTDTQLKRGWNSSSTTNGGTYWSLPAAHQIYSLKSQVTVIVVANLAALPAFGGGTSGYGKIFDVPYASTHTSPFSALCFGQGAEPAGGRGLVEIGGYTNSAITTSTSYLEAGITHVYAVTYSGMSVAFYRDGILFPSTNNIPANTQLSFANTRPPIIFNHNSSDPGEGFTGSCNAVFVFNRALSADEIARISFDAEQFFAAPRSVSAGVAASSLITLIGTPATTTPTADTGAISQTHILAGATATGAPTATTGAISQQHALSGTAATAAPTATAGPISQRHILAGSLAATTPTATTGTITIPTITLAGSPVSVTPAAITGAIVQRHLLSGATADSAPTAQPGTIAQTHTLAGNSAVCQPTAPAGAISMRGELGIITNPGLYRATPSRVAIRATPKTELRRAA